MDLSTAATATGDDHDIDDRQARAAAALALAALAIGLRIATLVEVPINWDAAQFVLGAGDFDVTRHQPHPPGYPLYVAVGAGFGPLVGGAARALSLLSALSGGLAVWLLYRLGREIASPAIGLAAAGLFTTSPLAWYYGSVNLAYGPESALAALVALLAWRSRARRDAHATLWASAALAVTGGTRPSALLLLLPLWLFGLIGHRPTIICRAIATLTVGCLLWLVPLLWLSGGLGRYIGASMRLASLAGSSSILSDGAAAVASNAWFVAVSLLLGLGPGLAVVASPRPRPLWRAGRAGGVVAFFTVWIAPPLAVFVAVHVGQPGYVLIVFPALCLLLAQALMSLGRRLAVSVGDRRLEACPIVLAVVANAAVFLATGNALTASTLADEQTFWRRVGELRAGQPPEDSIVITGGRSTESFRQATVVLPEYAVYAVGVDRRGRVGLLFSARAGGSDYDRYLDGRAPGILEPPPGTLGLVVLDDSAADLVGQLLPLQPATRTGAHAAFTYRAVSSIGPLDLRAAGGPAP